MFLPSFPMFPVYVGMSLFPCDLIVQACNCKLQSMVVVQRLLFLQSFCTRDMIIIMFIIVGRVVRVHLLAVVCAMVVPVVIIMIEMIMSSTVTIIHPRLPKSNLCIDAANSQLPDALDSPAEQVPDRMTKLGGRRRRRRQQSVRNCYISAIFHDF